MMNKASNWLLYTSAGIYFCTLILNYFITLNYPYLIDTQTVFDNNRNIFLLLISALFIAPIFEEITFRSLFTKHKYAKIIFLIGSTLFSLLTENYYVLVLIIPYFILITKKKIKTNISYIVNAIIFSLLHYQLSDFSNLYNLIPTFYQFSIGLLLIWFTINFGLKWSIVAHTVLNFVFIAPLVLVLQFPDNTTYTVNSHNTTMIWSKTPILNIQKIDYSHHKIIAENITIKDLIHLVDNNNTKLYIEDSLNYYRFNFTIENKTKKIDALDIEEILLKSKLAIENK